MKAQLRITAIFSLFALLSPLYAQDAVVIYYDQKKEDTAQAAAKSLDRDIVWVGMPDDVQQCLLEKATINKLAGYFDDREEGDPSVTCGPYETGCLLVLMDWCAKEGGHMVDTPDGGWECEIGC